MFINDWQDLQIRFESKIENGRSFNFLQMFSLLSKKLMSLLFEGTFKHSTRGGLRGGLDGHVPPSPPQNQLSNSFITDEKYWGGGNVVVLLSISHNFSKCGCEVRCKVRNYVSNVRSSKQTLKVKLVSLTHEALKYTVNYDLST